MSEDRLLLVEDEPALARGLSDTLVAQGFDVQIAGRRSTWLLEIALSLRPDLILLDIMLPQVNGFEICRSVRKHEPTVPILILSAKDQEIDKIMGLDLGADDYITKPFRTGELIARAKALLGDGVARTGRCSAPATATST